MSWKSKPSWYHAKGEAPMQTSAEVVRTYSAMVDALTATVINAEAGLSWLSAQPPDLEGVRQALNGIANDGKRAGEIVVRLSGDVHFRAAVKGKSELNGR